MKSRISIIAAMDKNRLIGGKNKLLWHIPGELKRFKQITSGHPIIMGRNTFESIGRVLPNRTNIIITRDRGLIVAGAIIVYSLNEAIDIAKGYEGSEEIFVIGGGQIYEQALKLADRLYLTVVEGEYQGDTYFPEYTEFKKIVNEDVIQEGDIHYKLQILER